MRTVLGNFSLQEITDFHQTPRAAGGLPCPPEGSKAANSSSGYFPPRTGHRWRSLVLTTEAMKPLLMTTYQASSG